MPVGPQQAQPIETVEQQEVQSGERQFGLGLDAGAPQYPKVFRCRRPPVQHEPNL
jgi:hypothetical protein